MGKSAEALRILLDLRINKERSISVTELSRKTQIPRPSIYGYLAGTIPDLDTLDKIAEALDLDASDLIRSAGYRSQQEIEDEKVIARIKRALACLRDQEEKPPNLTPLKNTLLTAAEPTEIKKK